MLKKERDRALSRGCPSLGPLTTFCAPFVPRLLGSPRALAGAGGHRLPVWQLCLANLSFSRDALHRGKSGSLAHRTSVAVSPLLLHKQNLLPLHPPAAQGLSPRQPGATGQMAPHILSLGGTLRSRLCLLLLSPPVPRLPLGRVLLLACPTSKPCPSLGLKDPRDTRPRAPLQR